MISDEHVGPPEDELVAAIERAEAPIHFGNYSLKKMEDRGERMLHVCIPTRGTIACEMSAFCTHLPIICGRTNILYQQVNMQMRLPVEAARNVLAGQVLAKIQGRPDLEHYVLWTDDDMAPRNEDLRGLIIDLWANPKFGALSAWVCQKMHRDPGFVYGGAQGRLLLPGVDYTVGEIVRVAWSGMGFFLHHGLILDELAKNLPLEPLVVNGKTLHENGEPKMVRAFFKTHDTDPTCGEDSYFSRSIINAGYPVGVDTAIKVRHVNTVTGEYFEPWEPSKEADIKESIADERTATAGG